MRRPHLEDPMFTLQHVVLPEPDNIAALPLYVDSQWTKTLPWAGGACPAADRITRTSLRLPAGTDATFGTYMNAFPASYWRAHTVVEQVRLVLELSGTGTVLVRRSDEHGQRYGILSRPVQGDTTVELDIELGDCAAGGWIWFDLRASDGADLTLVSGRWETPAEPVRSGRTNTGMTTHNKRDWCVASLRQLAASPATLELLGQVVVVDQGDQVLEEATGFAEVAAQLGDQLRVVHQPNLGGSGGFTRGMFEAVRDGVDNVLLLDDDVRLEPEGIRRAITFARFATRPMIVGGQMCDLHRPAVLHAFSEWVDPENFLWNAAPGSERKHDFASQPLLDTPWLHQRIDGEHTYNGWWMCLIPTEVVRAVGYSLPFFLKWDDAEYGLRAAEAGYPTVSLPGAPIWHVAWLDKDDGIDWQLYFHIRNRLVAALLHGRPGVGAVLSGLLFRQTLRHVLAMQYYTAAMSNRALRDVLAGPQTLHAGIASIVSELRGATAHYPEAVRRSPADVPTPAVTGVRGAAAPQDGKPEGRALIPFAAKAFLRGVLKPVPRDAATRPQAAFAHRYGEWWRTPAYDSVLVPTADDTAYFWYRRDRRALLRLMRENVVLYRELRSRWDDLARDYREHTADLAGETAWRRTLGLPPVP